MAYRSQREQKRTETTTVGLVADMVRQFADRYAFVRELVQNGIDAGATGLEVSARYLGGEGLFSVRDDGVGMTRDIIEGPLLTLFNSAKDEDDSKIGKYGVGFVSVFAIDPEEVMVESWRADGESWLLRLLPDHSYELAKGDPPRFGRSGTLVTLRKRMHREGFREHLDAVFAAAHRWCRFARLPIHFRSDEEGAEASHRRVDMPLAVVSPVSLAVEIDGMTVAIGPAIEGAGDAGNAEPLAGFYNRGLTLFETSEVVVPELAGLCFKVDSPRLSHTLSRDNVRHDEAYHRALGHVRALARGELRRAAITRLAETAHAAAASEDARADFDGLLRACCLPSLAIDVDELTVPLCDPVAGQLTCRVADLEHRGLALYDAESGPVTRALAAEGRPVLLAHWVAPALQALVAKLGCAMQPARLSYSVLSPMDAPDERAWLDRVQQLLQEAGVRVRALRLAEVAGSPVTSVVVRVDDASRPRVVPAEDRARRFRWGRPDHWLLPVTHQAVMAARHMAQQDGSAAAELLARFVLVDLQGEISKRQSDAMLEVGDP